MCNCVGRSGRGRTRRQLHNAPRPLLGSLLGSHMLMKFREQVCREECINMRMHMQIVCGVQHRLLDLQFPSHFSFRLP